MPQTVRSSLDVSTYESSGDMNFPDEILDAIIESLDEGSSDDPNTLSRRPKEKSAWKACSLVCKRWHNIVLPHLFRSIGIRTLEALAHFVRFFTETRIVANQVKALDLEDIQTDVYVLQGLLRALPPLQCLNLESVTIRNGDMDSAHPPQDVLSLQALTYEDSRDVRLVQCTTVVNLLGLFSDIGTLTLRIIESEEHEPDDERFAEAHAIAFAAANVSRKTRIRRLQYGGRHVGGLFVPAYLLKTGAVDNLTHLAFTCTHNTKWEPFCHIVSAAHSTLTGVNIRIRRYSRRVSHNDFAAMEKSFSMCTVLESVAVSVDLFYSLILKYIRHPDGKRVSAHYYGHSEYWLQTIRILRLIPVARLLRVAIGLQGTSTDAHILDWARLKEWCSGIPHLERIDIEIRQSYDQRGCFAYEMQGFNQVFTPRFVLPLPTRRLSSL
ncbi:hypothetical protein BDY19DRAFT_385715 [Irpex rosettiformis]|uniref:Uncharacterized protein n=1 Tax=Irpex rosettiformis TaxID=378272 RepID=A0ACB8TVC8_9APHY|nr:hypothetical protein BDY19DRAFT_385715 [Irpex rosettiformis]